MARYKGEFNQMTTGNHYTVMISTGGDTSSTPTEITLGANPFTVSLSGDDIYKQARYSKATLQVRTTDYMMTLYAAGAHDVKVEMTDEDDNVVWTGYATPNLYDMGFAYERNTIEIELVDALSTLRYYPYERGSSTTISFLDIINKCLTQAGSYTKFYFSANTQKESSGTSEMLSTIYISEQNFFDEKDDSSETDADVAWTYKEVLEGICLFMGVTAVAVGDAVYFIDYDAIRAGNYNYYMYTVGASTGTLTTVGEQRTIVSSDFSANSSAISLDQIYNKVKVKDSLYDFDELIPEVFDDNYLTNVTATDADGSIATATMGSTAWTCVNMGNTQAGRQLKIMAEADDAKYKSFFKFYTNPHYTLHQYTQSGDDLVDSTTDSANYTRMMTTIGAYLERISVNRVSSYSQSPSSVSFSDYIVIRWLTFDGQGTGRSELSDDDKYPMIESADDTDSIAFFGGDNAYIIIQGKVRCLAELVGFPPSDTHVDSGGHNNFGDRMWLPAQLKIGNYYWVGNGWSTTAAKFKLYFSESDVLDGEDNGGLDADRFYNQDFNFRNTVEYEDGLDQEGYAIPLSGLPLTLARPKLTIYNPHRMVTSNTLDTVFISGLKVVAAIANPDNDDKDSDTEYVNIINNGSVSSKSSDDWKICTWDNKKPNYSAPAYYDGTGFEYIDKTFNRACYSGESTWESSDEDGLDGTNGLRQEEHLIYRMVNQYSTPSVILKLPLRADLTPVDQYIYEVDILAGKKFVMTAMSIDYKENTSSVTLVEKK